MVDISTLRSTVFSILRGDGIDLDTLTLKELRASVITRLNLENTSFNGESLNTTLKSMIDDYKLVNVANTDSDTLKCKSRFSPSESKFITDVLKEYLVAHDLNYSEICPELREVLKIHKLILQIYIQKDQITFLKNIFLN
jgi:hypothetical protein